MATTSTPRRARGRAPATTAWLDADERAAWLSLIRVVTRLPSVLDAQLQRDADLTFFEYTVLAMLSEQPDRTLRMSRLAAVTDSSLSRLSHVAKRLEKSGLLRRELDREDGRCTNAIITDEGYARVEATAPVHVAAVRSLILDPLTPTELRQLRVANELILGRIDPNAATDPT